MEMRQIRPTSHLNEDLQPILPKAGCQAESIHFNETYFHIKAKYLSKIYSRILSHF